MKPMSKPTLWPTMSASPTKSSSLSAASFGLGAPLTSVSVMPCIWLPTIGRPGFTNVKGAPSPKEAADKLLDFVGDALIVGHNVGFDLGFILSAGVAAGVYRVPALGRV